MESMLVSVAYHYENVPTWIRPCIETIFMNRRNLAVRAVTGSYQAINEEWDKDAGEEAAFGPYLEDMNPRYEAFVNERIQPILDEKVNKGKIFQMVSGRYCDLEMRIAGLKNSRIWIDLKEIK